MKRSITSVSLTLLASLLIASDRAAPPTTQPDLAKENSDLKLLLKQFAGDLSRALSENQAMKQQLADLRAENNKLKAELSGNGAKTNALPKLAPFSLTVPPGQNPQPPGKDWRPFEYNGRTVYVVPLKKDSIDAIDTQIDQYRRHSDRNLDLIDDRPKQR